MRSLSLVSTAEEINRSRLLAREGSRKLTTVDRKRANALQGEGECISPLRTSPVPFLSCGFFPAPNFLYAMRYVMVVCLLLGLGLGACQCSEKPDIGPVEDRDASVDRYGGR